MTSIVEVAAYVPGQVSLADRARELDLPLVEVRRFERAFGFDQIACDPAQTETDILLGAAGKLQGLAGCEDRIRYVLRPRTVRWPSPYPMSPLQDIRDALGLRHAQAFAITEQACAGGLFAVDTAGAMLAEDGDPDALALILVGEKTYGRVGQIIPGMAVLGEAHGRAARLGERQPRPRAWLRGLGRAHPGGRADHGRRGVQAFGQVYAGALGDVMSAALETAATAPSDLALYLPHNVNRMLCLRTGTALGLSHDQVVTGTIREVAHCWGADPFLNYRHAVELGGWPPATATS